MKKIIKELNKYSKNVARFTAENMSILQDVQMGNRCHNCQFFGVIDKDENGIIGNCDLLETITNHSFYCMDHTCPEEFAIMQEVKETK